MVGYLAKNIFRLKNNWLVFYENILFFLEIIKNSGPQSFNYCIFYFDFFLISDFV
jgi:hypothetical protein